MVQEQIDTFVESFNNRENNSDSNSLDIVDDLNSKEIFEPATIDIYNQTIVQEDYIEEEEQTVVVEKPEQQTISNFEDKIAVVQSSKRTIRNKGWQTEENPP